jgi:hypothetical protein
MAWHVALFVDVWRDRDNNPFLILFHPTRNRHGNSKYKIPTYVQSGTGTLCTLHPTHARVEVECQNGKAETVKLLSFVLRLVHKI